MEWAIATCHHVCTCSVCVLSLISLVVCLAQSPDHPTPTQTNHRIVYSQATGPENRSPAPRHSRRARLLDFNHQATYSQIGLVYAALWDKSLFKGRLAHPSYFQLVFSRRGPLQQESKPPLELSESEMPPCVQRKQALLFQQSRRWSQYRH